MLGVSSILIEEDGYSSPVGRKFIVHPPPSCLFRPSTDWLLPIHTGRMMCFIPLPVQQGKPTTHTHPGMMFNYPYEYFITETS